MRLGASIEIDLVIHAERGFAVLHDRTVDHATTGTGAAMITSFINDAATATSGILRAVGTPSLVYNLPKVLAAGVNAAIDVAATAVKIGLRTVAGALDLGSTITGAVTPHAITAASSAALAVKRSTVAAAETEGTTNDATDAAEDIATPGHAVSKPSTSQKSAAAALTDPAESTIADDRKPAATSESTATNLLTDRAVPEPPPTAGTKTRPAATASSAPQTPHHTDNPGADKNPPRHHQGERAGSPGGPR